jgi:DNA helicase-2/ATP-dependent DNA helicase PcrA
LPLVIEARAANEFGVMEILRRQTKQLRPELIQKRNVAEVLANLRHHTQHFQKLLVTDSKATVSEVLKYLMEADLVELDPRLLSYITEKEIAEETPKEEKDQDEDDLSKEIASMEAFLKCPASQLLGYYTSA